MASEKSKSMCNQFLQQFFTSFTRFPEKLAGFYSHSDAVCASFGDESSKDVVNVTAAEIQETVQKMNIGKETVVINNHEILEHNSNFLITVLASYGSRRFIQSFLMTATGESSASIERSIFRWLGKPSPRKRATKSAPKKGAVAKGSKAGAKVDKAGAKVDKAGTKVDKAAPKEKAAPKKPAPKKPAKAEASKPAPAETAAPPAETQADNSTENKPTPTFEELQKEAAKEEKPAHTGPKSWAMIAAKDKPSEEPVGDGKIVPRVERQPDPKVLLAKQKQQRNKTRPNKRGAREGREGREAPQKTSTLFIAQLPKDVEAKQLEEAFSKYGKITDGPHIQPEKSIAFVTFDTPEAAAAAVNDSEHTIAGAKIAVKFSTYRSPGKRKNRNGKRKDGEKREGGKPRSGPRKDDPKRDGAGAKTGGAKTGGARTGGARTGGARTGGAKRDGGKRTNGPRDGAKRGSRRDGPATKQGDAKPKPAAKKTAAPQKTAAKPAAEKSS